MIHEVVMFEQNSREGRDGKSEPGPTKGNLYYVPTRNPRTGRLVVNTLPKKDFYPVQINEVGPEQDYVHYRKPSLLDAPIDKQTKHDLKRLLEENHDAFAEDERQIGTTPLIKMSINTSDHLPIAKKCYALALKHYNWVRDEIDKCLRQVSSKKATQVGQPQLWLYPRVMVARCMDFKALNAITRIYV